MYPKISDIDKVSCLESLIGVRTDCSISENYPFWIEDTPGVDIKELANVAKGTDGTGKDFAKKLINSAAREMMGDIELLLNNGFKLNPIVNDICSSCTLSPSYLANTGITVKILSKSPYSVLRIKKLLVLINATGEKTIVINDGVEAKNYTINASAGVLLPVNLNYSTTEKSVKIYFSDNTIGLGSVTCATASSCGCGSKSSNAGSNDIVITGLLNGSENSNQYGFIPCVSLDCSYDAVVCGMIKSTPNIFGLALSFKVADKYFAHNLASNRNNEAVSYNEEDKTQREKNYGMLYWAKMKGTASTNGIKHIMNDFLRMKRNDKCVICDSKISTAYATG